MPTLDGALEDHGKKETFQREVVGGGARKQTRGTEELGSPVSAVDARFSAG